MLPLRFLPKTSKNDVLWEKGTNLGDKGKLNGNTLTCSEQVTCEDVLEASGNMSLGCLYEGTLGAVFPESPGNAMEGMNSPAPLVCLERQASKGKWTLALSCQKTGSAIPGSHLMTRE